jgi:hypothetical protein
MNNNPLEESRQLEARIRQRAHHLWQRDGSPEGRQGDYLENARELIAIEDSPGAGQLPNPIAHGETEPGPVIEEAAIQDNYGELPGLQTDQGERRQTPMTREQLRKSAPDPA